MYSVCHCPDCYRSFLPSPGPNKERQKYCSGYCARRHWHMKRGNISAERRIARKTMRQALSVIGGIK